MFVSICDGNCSKLTLPDNDNDDEDDDIEVININELKNSSPSSDTIFWGHFVNLISTTISDSNISLVPEPSSIFH